MPEGMINQAASTRPNGAPLLSADQMRPLWEAVGEAVTNYREEDEARTGDAVISAQERIADARTVDPLAIAYKLRATRHWRDPVKGLAEDLKSSDVTARTIATIIRDAEATSAKLARRSARRIPSRLRPLWDAYQTTWKGLSDVMEEEDAAMIARPHGTPPGTTEAEKAAKAKRAVANKAFAAANEAFEEAPTRTFDDALCRVEYVLELIPQSDIAAALNEALRVLRRVHQTA